MIKTYLLIVATLFAAANAFAHSEAIKPKFVDSLIPSYLEIQKALAADNLGGAKIAAESYIKALNMQPSFNQKPSIIKIKTAVSRIEKSDEIGNARSEFLTLSEEMRSMIDHVGTTGSSPLYLAHCPMAFGNKGGSWIQDDETVANPYYGAMMLRCGSIKEQIAKKRVNSHRDDINDAHGHAEQEPDKLAPASAATIASQGKDYPKTCVVSDESLIEGEVQNYVYQGQLVRFCCKGCKNDFVKNPDAYMLKLKELKSSLKSHLSENHGGHDHSAHGH